MVIHNEIFDSFRLEQKKKKLKRLELSNQKEETIDDIIDNIQLSVIKLKKAIRDKEHWDQYITSKKKKNEYS